MNVVDNLTLVGVSWGTEYFSKYKERWVASVLALDPAPAHIVIATDRELPLPPHFRQVPIEQPYHWEAFNCAVRAAETEWVCGLMLDDTMPSDGLVDIDMSGDVESSIAIDSHGSTMKPDPQRWRDAMDQPWYPLSGFQVIKRDVFLRFPYRPVEWADWIQALEWLAAGVDVRFSNRVRQHYTLHAGQHSRPKNFKLALERIQIVKQMIREGGVKPGNVWPPEPA